MDFLELVNDAISRNASDIHITVGIPPTIRVNGELQSIGEKALMPPDTENLVMQALDDKQKERLQEKGELDLSFSAKGIGRLRINAFKQRSSYSMAIRIVNLTIPSMDDLGLPPIVKQLSEKRRGLILVTGPTGSGKSTTLASMIDQINHERSGHILTLEDPIEYLHKHNKSIVNQREIGLDSDNFSNALRASLRQDPDVILVGEMRDLETISIAITAAETGHLVLSTLHTLGAAKTIDRVIDVFPPHQQQQVRTQLSSVLQGIVSQQLLPTKDNKGRVAAFEIMVGTPAIRSLIREGKTHQIQTMLQTGTKYGMETMDMFLLKLFKQGKISSESLLSYAVDKDMILRFTE